MSTPETQIVTQPKQSLVVKFAGKYGVDSDKMLATLKATAFKTRAGDPEISNEQMMALLIVADQYHLNPFTREIYAFPDKGGIVPVVGVDGWARIINERVELDGIEFNEAEDGAWIECVMYRKDRAHAITIREWLSECKRQTQPWNTHPRRMLRHKALIQCARIAFGFAGIFDPDEAEVIRDANERVVSVQGTTRAEQAKSLLRPITSPVEQKPEVKSAEVVTTVAAETKPAIVTEAKQEPTHAVVADAPLTPADPDVVDQVALRADSITRLGNAKTIKELRQKWEFVLDCYNFSNLEIPPDVEDKFKMMRETLNKK